MKRLYGSLLLFTLVGLPAVNAQFTGSYTGAWSTTWNNPTSSLASVMIQGYINKKMLQRSVANQRAGKAGRPSGSASAGTTSPAAATPPGAAQDAAPDYTVLTFKPIANSGVVKQTADALSEDPAERAQLVEIFQEIKKGYEAEVAKDGKSNNIAAALTFFMASASMAYHQSGEPAERTTDGLLEILEQDLSASSAFRKMTHLEKQKMHDWLVVSGGFLLAGYLDAVQKNDQSQLGDYKQLADGFFKIVFGTGAEKLNLAAIGTTVSTAPGAPEAPVVNSEPAATSSAMHATDLVKAFEANEVRANQSYSGKRLQIHGTVNSIESAPGGNAILIFNRSALTYSNVKCHFSRSHASGVAALNANGEVTVEGTVRGFGGGAMGIKAYVVMEDCVVR